MVIILSACATPTYYLQATKGHLTLMHARQDISDLLHNPDTRPQLAEDLEKANSLRDFANDQLDLPANDSYTTYVETGRDAVIWNVVATPEFSLAPKKWCFPVAGCVPYRGYFNEEKARRFAGKLQDKGLDVSVTAATAYSTLGWFSDPVLDTMLQGPQTQLAGTLFHELAHQRLYVKGDTSFNESYAGFVERAGIRHWLNSSGDLAMLDRWQRRQSALGDFRNLLSQTRRRLQDLYDTSGLPDAEKRRRKKQIFDDLRAQYDRLSKERWSGRDLFGGWFTPNGNNAGLALFHSYEGGICAFRALFATAQQDFSVFHSLAAERSTMEASQRREWLQQACRGIASQDDL